MLEELVLFETDEDELLLDELLDDEVLTLEVLDEEDEDELLEELVDFELVEDEEEELELDEELLEVVVSVMSVSDALNAYSDIRLFLRCQPSLSRFDRRGIPEGMGHTATPLPDHLQSNQTLWTPH